MIKSPAGDGTLMLFVKFTLFPAKWIVGLVLQPEWIKGWRSTFPRVGRGLIRLYLYVHPLLDGDLRPQS